MTTSRSIISWFAQIASEFAHTAGGFLKWASHAAALHEVADSVARVLVVSAQAVFLECHPSGACLTGDGLSGRSVSGVLTPDTPLSATTSSKFANCALATIVPYDATLRRCRPTVWAEAFELCLPSR
jgi:hypothetical protein